MEDLICLSTCVVGASSVAHEAWAVPREVVISSPAERHQESGRGSPDQTRHWTIFVASSLNSFSRFSFLKFLISSSSSCIRRAASLLPPISSARFCRSVFSYLRRTSRWILLHSRRTPDRAFLTARRVKTALSIRRSVIELTVTLEIGFFMAGAVPRRAGKTSRVP